jgi:NUDIX domain
MTSPRLIGAGVLCAALDGHGEIVLLLGREREVLNWKYGSSKWCAFSGRAEEGESALENATREFLEESCSVVKLQEDSALPLQREPALQSLRGALVERRLSRASRSEEDLHEHVTFICRVPYDPLLPARFSETHARLWRANAVFKKFQAEKRACERLPRAFCPGFAFGERVFTVGLEVEDSERLAVVEVLDEADASVHLWRFRLCERALLEAKAVSRAWKQVEDYVLQERASGLLQHPAFVLNYRSQRLVSAFVNGAFLEKTELGWFKLASLESLPGLGRDCFKAHFLESVRSFSEKIRGLFAEGGGEELELLAAERRVHEGSPSGICVH